MIRLFTMFFKVCILSVLAVCVVEINAGARVVRSPQFGSASQASAKASSGSFGRPGQFGNPGFGGGKPGFGGPGFGGPGFGGPGFGKPGFGGPGVGGPGFGGPGFGGPGFGGPGFGGNRPGSGPTINIAKSVSISSGRGGAAKANAKSSSG